MRSLLLLSTSTTPGGGYLEHCEALVRSHLAGCRSLLFVPYALHDRAGYAARARARFATMGIEFASLHAADDPVRAIETAEALFIGGGNTFRLLAELYAQRLLAPIRSRVEAGMPYLGASAGSNIACPTIRTTNDMPIVEPPSFAALGLVPFQINPHYPDPPSGSTLAGETRDQRLHEFHEMNMTPVVAMREGTIIEVEDDRCTIIGNASARLFRRGKDPTDLAPGTDMSFLLH